MARESKSVLRSPSGLFFVLFVVVGVGVHFLGYDQVDDHDLARRYLPISLSFPLGTDGYGRNVLMLLLKGIQAFFVPGLVAALIAGGMGSLLGGICGYLDGRVKRVILWFLGLVDALPRLVMLILLCSLTQPSMMLIATAVGILFVPSLARTVQYRVEALAAEDYILAYRAHGFSSITIVGYHIVWMICRPVIIRQAAYVFGYVLFVETALSYLEFGVLEGVEDILSWGTMVAQAKNETGSWSPGPGEAHILGLYWLAPAIAIVATTAGVLGIGNRVAQEGEK
jgi:ABC-type dipeptide/oligopeptide/nickel transport system permease subunit